MGFPQGNELTRSRRRRKRGGRGCSGAEAVGTWYLQEETHTGCKKEGKALSVAWSRYSLRWQLLGCPGGTWGSSSKQKGSALASSE